MDAVQGLRTVLRSRWLIYRTLITVQAARNPPATRRTVAVSLLCLI